MSRVFGLILAGGMVLAGANRADAQISVTLGNPYTGGISIGTPNYGGYGYGGGYGYDGYYGSSLYSPLYAPGLGGVTTYSSGYSGYAAPGTSVFSSGYYSGYPGLGYAPSYGFAPAYGYGRSFGYGPLYRSGFGYGGWGRGMRGGWSRW